MVGNRDSPAVTKKFPPVFVPGGMLHKIDYLGYGKNHVEGPGCGDSKGKRTVNDRLAVFIGH
jgi:hypothetical protein